MGQRQSEIIKNHMEVYWHDYASASKGVPITEAGLVEKASVIGRTGLMLLECGTGAWRVRSSMNTLSRELGVTTTADIGLLSIEFTCFDGDQCYTQSLCLTNTGVNTSRLNRLEHFVNDFDREGKFMTGEELHSHLDEIERIHGLYSPIALGFAAALACGCFTFLLGGGIVEMLCAFCGAGIGNFVRCKLTKHHFTLFLGITASVCSASLVYAILLKLAEVLFAVSAQHEAGYICSMLFIIPGFPFITSGIDLAKRLRGAGCRAEIIFITSHFECMAEGYEVDALHYLVKPVPAEKLRAVLDRAAARLAVEPPSVVIACEEGNVKLYESELLYAESFLHDLVLHYRIRESISAFAGRLSADFFRTHRSYLVNLKAVVRIGRTSVLLRGGAEVPLARGKYDAINRAFID